MCAALEHRGPDSRGLHVDAGRRPRHPAPARDRPRDRRPADLQRGRLGRGRPQRRDLQLPRAARASCERRATASRTQGDTEVIVAPLRGARAPRCVDRLHGMFALARLGRARGGGCCWRATASARSRSTTPSATARSSFASELAALLAGRRGPARRRPRARSTPTSPTAGCPTPLTAFRAVRKLPPGSTLVLRGRRATIERYWQLDYSRKRRGRRSRARSHEELREQIRARDRAAADRRRAARRVPLRRRRLGGGGGRDGRGVDASR